MKTVNFLVPILFLLVLPAHAGLTNGKDAKASPRIDQLSSEIGQATFSSLFRGLKEEMDPKDFDRAMAAFQDLRKPDHDPTTEEVLRAIEKGDRQAFDILGLFRRMIRACVPSYVDVNREVAAMNREEANWKRNFNRSNNCSTSLENILQSRRSNQQTAGVVSNPTTTGGASAAN